MRQVPATLLCRVADVSPGWYPHGLSVGPDHEPILHLLDRPPGDGHAGNAVPARFRALHLTQGGIRTLTLPSTRPEIGAVQPLPGGNWLVVSWFRAGRRFGGSKPADNARILRPNGDALGSFYVGSVWSNLQLASDGTLWVGYTDQGGYAGEKTGEGGLARFDLSGNLLFGFNRSLKAGSLNAIWGEGQEVRRYGMIGCAALNVVSPEEVWVAYAAYDYPIARLSPAGLGAIWPDSCIFPNAMAVDGHRVLAGGLYGYKTSLFLLTLDTLEIEEWQPVDEEGSPVLGTRDARTFEQVPYLAAAYRIAARGSLLYVLTEAGELYRLDLHDIQVHSVASGIAAHSLDALSQRVESAEIRRVMEGVIAAVVRDLAGTEDGRRLLVRAIERHAELRDDVDKTPYGDRPYSHVVSRAVGALATHWNDVATRQLLRGWARSNDDLIRKEALEELGYLCPEDAGTYALAHDLVGADSSAPVREASLLILARHWPQAPDTYDMICDRALHDPDHRVQHSALDALEGWITEPRTRAILIDRLLSASNPADHFHSVHSAALRLLSRRVHDDPDVSALLERLVVEAADASLRSEALRALGSRADLVLLFRNRAMADQAPSPRMAALESLIEHAVDDPRTLALVQERASLEDDSSDRWTALMLLVQHWPNHPETRWIVWERAVNDLEPYNRDRALSLIHSGFVTDIDRLAELCDLLRLGPDEAAEREARELIAGAVRRGRQADDC